MEELSNLTFFNKQICQLTGEDNFQLWKQQVLLEVKGFNLEGYLFDTLHVPHMLASISSSISKVLVGCMLATSI